MRLRCIGNNCCPDLGCGGVNVVRSGRRLQEAEAGFAVASLDVVVAETEEEFSA